MNNRTVCLTIFTWVLLALSSCKPGPPKGVLSESKMEDVLYDYHLAQGMAAQQTPDSTDYYTRFYEQAVFRKHGVDARTFDFSMQWYTRHTEKLDKIYERLASRNCYDTEDAQRQPGTAFNVNAKDTIDVWTGKRQVIINSKENNCFTFAVADTAIHAGDILQWNFSVDWHYHDGTRRAEALLLVEYEGDSIMQFCQSVTTSGTQTIVLRTGDLKVKRVAGFIYQSSPWSERPRLLAVSHLQLLCMRSANRNNQGYTTEKAKEQQEGDSTAQSGKKELSPQLRIRDSLLRQDSMNERKPHFR